MGKLFIPHELKTIEVDVEKRTFKVNGEDFGHGCTYFSISCNDYDSFDIRLEIDTRIRFAVFRDGKLVSDESIIPHHPETRQDHTTE